MVRTLQILVRLEREPFLEQEHILLYESSSMQTADDYEVNQELLQPPGTLPLDNEPEMETTIACLKRQCEAVRQHEVKRIRGRLGQLSSTQDNAIESLTRSIVDQILETPIDVLKAASDDGDAPAVISIVRRAFNLTLDRT